jgi:hypothetical protein
LLNLFALEIAYTEVMINAMPVDNNNINKNNRDEFAKEFDSDGI